MEEGEQVSEPFGSVLSTIHQLKKQVLANRAVFVKERIESNGNKLAAHTAHLISLTESRKAQNLTGQDGAKDMLTLRIESALCKLSGPDSTSGDKEIVNCQEEGSSASSTIIFASSSGCKSIVRYIKLPSVQMIPPYTTWIFLDRIPSNIGVMQGMGFGFHSVAWRLFFYGNKRNWSNLQEQFLLYCLALILEPPTSFVVSCFSSLSRIFK
eukprot:Gb_34683 [translate_table: standard]